MANEIVKSEEITEEITPIDTENPVKGMYSSFKGESREERLTIFEAVTNAERLEDHLNEKISVQHVIIQPVRMADRVTGEIREGNRIVLCSNDGVAYACMSEGVETAIKQLFGIVGMPPWNPPIDFKAVKQQGRNSYKFTTLQLWKD